MMNKIEQIAEAMFLEDSKAAHEVGSWEEASKNTQLYEVYCSSARAAIEALLEPSDYQWDGLARHLVLWLDMEPKTPRALFQHLKRSGLEIPQWLNDESEMQVLDHVPSKGTRAVLVYKAMLHELLKD